MRELNTKDKALNFWLRKWSPAKSVSVTPYIYGSSEARRGDITKVSGQRPEQGADAKFFAKQKTWAQGPYPAQ